MLVYLRDGTEMKKAEISSSSSAFPSYISGVHHFLGEIFAYVTAF